MCGIIGVTGPDQAAPHILDGLRRLEYRGYDSAGLATLANGLIELRRAEGKLIELERLVARSPVSGTTGIGHTRWATHGAPSETNAHPHMPPAASRWSTTASSRTTASSGPSWRRRGASSSPTPIPRWFPT